MTSPPRRQTLLWSAAINSPSGVIGLPLDEQTLAEDTTPTRPIEFLDELSLGVDALALQRRIAVASDETLDVVLESMRKDQGLPLADPSARREVAPPVAPAPRQIITVRMPPATPMPVAPALAYQGARVVRTLPLAPPVRPPQPRPAPPPRASGSVGRALLALTAAAILATASYAALASALPGAVLARDHRAAPPEAVPLRTQAAEAASAPLAPLSPLLESPPATPTPAGAPAPRPAPAPPKRAAAAPPPGEAAEPVPVAGGAIDEIDVRRGQRTEVSVGFDRDR